MHHFNNKNTSNNLLFPRMDTLPNICPIPSTISHAMQEIRQLVWNDRQNNTPARWWYNEEVRFSDGTSTISYQQTKYVPYIHPFIRASHVQSLCVLPMLGFPPPRPRQTQRAHDFRDAIPLILRHLFSLALSCLFVLLERLAPLSRFREFGRGCDFGIHFAFVPPLVVRVRFEGQWTGGGVGCQEGCDGLSRYRGLEYERYVGHRIDVVAS